MRRIRRTVKLVLTCVSYERVDEEPRDRQLNIHIDPENLAGVYANFANVDHEVEEGDVPGVVVSRVVVSHKFMKDLLDAMQDTYSKWTTTEGIRNLPEAPPRDRTDD